MKTAISLQAAPETARAFVNDVQHTAFLDSGPSPLLAARNSTYQVQGEERFAAAAGAIDHRQPRARHHAFDDPFRRLAVKEVRDGLRRKLVFLDRLQIDMTVVLFGRQDTEIPGIRMPCGFAFLWALWALGVIVFELVEGRLLEILRPLFACLRAMLPQVTQRLFSMALPMVFRNAQGVLVVGKAARYFLARLTGLNQCEGRSEELARAIRPRRAIPQENTRAR